MKFSHSFDWAESGGRMLGPSRDPTKQLLLKAQSGERLLIAQAQMKKRKKAFSNASDNDLDGIKLALMD